MYGFECKTWGETCVTDTIFCRWELAVADDVYIRNEGGNNIDAQTYNTYQYIDAAFSRTYKCYENQQLLLSVLLQRTPNPYLEVYTYELCVSQNGRLWLHLVPSLQNKGKQIWYINMLESLHWHNDDEFVLMSFYLPFMKLCV